MAIKLSPFPNTSSGLTAQGVGGVSLSPFPTQQMVKSQYEQTPESYVSPEERIAKATSFLETAETDNLAQKALKWLGKMAISPLTPMAQNVAEMATIGKVIKGVDEGKYDPKILDEFAFLTKSNPQVVGDVAQMVLTFTPLKALKAVEGLPILSKLALKTTAKVGAQIGGAFGAATALSETPEIQPANILKQTAIGAVGGAVAMPVLGIATRGLGMGISKALGKEIKPKGAIKVEVKGEPSVAVKVPVKTKVTLTELPEAKIAPSKAVSAEKGTIPQELKTLKSAEGFIKTKTGTKITIDGKEDLMLGKSFIFDNGKVAVQTSIKETPTEVYLTHIHSKVSGDLTKELTGTGAGTNIINELKNYADLTGKKLIIPDATNTAVKDYWSKIPWLKEDYGIKIPTEKGGFYNPPNSYSYKPTQAVKGVSKTAEAVKPLETVGAGEMKIAGLAKGVEAKAVEAKLVKSLSDLPEYRTTNWKEQGVLSTQFLKDYPERSLKIAKGESIAPNNILPEAIFTAVENEALLKGDVATIRSLGQSGLTTEASAMGQRIGYLAQRNPDSPVAVIEDVIKTRTNKAIAKYKNIKGVKESIKNELKSELKKAEAQAKDWDSFISGITCK